MKLNDREIAIVKGMLARGDDQHHIAAYFGINSGRIAEINTGQKAPDIRAAPEEYLPPPGPYMAGRSALKVRVTLLALRDSIDQTLREIDLWEH